MEATPVLEFLLVSNNHHTLAAVTDGLEQIGIKFNFAATSEAGQEYMGRCKVDGVIVDLELPGAQELIHSIRRGNSNPDAAVFVCLPREAQSPVAVVPGANVLLPQPLTAESVAMHVSAARSTILGERRRFFRCQVKIPLHLASGAGEQRGMVTSLGEGGMAAYTVSAVARGESVQFEFTLPSGDSIEGKGSVVWANNERMIGAKFIFLRGASEEKLQGWLRQQLREGPET
ncbi:MAG: PilZ domain-containing protein [Acidobacteriota bacterium]|nr:PilZ domain-containing protein [Acidobacteriota bacterium]MDE3170052.1 PilZ domain-containing protein [Acidobacteriota bacterium]